MQRFAIEEGLFRLCLVIILTLFLMFFYGHNRYSFVYNSSVETVVVGDTRTGDCYQITLSNGGFIIQNPVDREVKGGKLKKENLTILEK